MKNYKTSVSVIALSAMLSLTACDRGSLMDAELFADEVEPTSTIKIVDETKGGEEVNQVTKVSENEEEPVDVADTDQDQDAEEDGEGWFSSWFGGDDEEEAATQKAALDEPPVVETDEAPEESRGDLLSWLFGDDEDDAAQTDQVAVANVLDEAEKVDVPKIDSARVVNVKRALVDDVNDWESDAERAARTAVEPTPPKNVAASAPDISVDDRAAQLRAELLGDLQDAENTRGALLGTQPKQVDFEDDNEGAEGAFEEAAVAGADVNMVKPDLDEKSVAEVKLAPPLNEDDMVEPMDTALDPLAEAALNEEQAKRDQSASLISRLIAEDRKRAPDSEVEAEKVAEKAVGAVNTSERKPVLMRAPRWTRTPSEEQATNLLARLEKEKKDITRVVSPDLAKVDRVLEEAEKAVGEDPIFGGQKRAKHVEVRDLYKVTKLSGAKRALPDVSDNVVADLAFDQANNRVAGKVITERPVKRQAIMLNPSQLSLLPSRVAKAEKTMEERIDAATRLDGAPVDVVEASKLSKKESTLDRGRMVVDNRMVKEDVREPERLPRVSSNAARSLGEPLNLEDMVRAQMDAPLPVFDSGNPNNARKEQAQSSETEMPVVKPASVIDDVLIADRIEPVFETSDGVGTRVIRMSQGVSSDSNTVAEMSDQMLVEQTAQPVEEQAVIASQVPQKSTSDVAIIETKLEKQTDSAQRPKRTQDPIFGETVKISKKINLANPSVEQSVAQENIVEKPALDEKEPVAEVTLVEPAPTQTADTVTQGEDRVALARQLMRQAQALLDATENTAQAAIEMPGENVVADELVVDSDQQSSEKVIIVETAEAEEAPKTLDGGINKTPRIIGSDVGEGESRSVDSRVSRGANTRSALPAREVDLADSETVLGESLLLNERRAEERAARPEPTSLLARNDSAASGAPARAETSAKASVEKEPVMEDKPLAKVKMVEPSDMSNNRIVVEELPDSVLEPQERSSEVIAASDEVAPRFDARFRAPMNVDLRPDQERARQGELNRLRQQAETSGFGIASNQEASPQFEAEPRKPNLQRQQAAGDAMQTPDVMMSRSFQAQQQAQQRQQMQRAVPQQAQPAQQRQRRIVVQPEYYYVPVPMQQQQQQFAGVNPNVAQQGAYQQRAQANMQNQQASANFQQARQQQYQAVPDYRRPVRRRAGNEFVNRGSADAARERVQRTAEELAKIQLNLRGNASNQNPNSSTQSSGQGGAQPFSSF